MIDKRRENFLCERERDWVIRRDGDPVAHYLAEEGTMERVMVRVLKELVEAGNDIRCYPSGAVGFDEWYDASEIAQLVLKQFVDEDGTWRPMEPTP